MVYWLHWIYYPTQINTMAPSMAHFSFKCSHKSNLHCATDNTVQYIVDWFYSTIIHPYYQKWNAAVLPITSIHLRKPNGFVSHEYHEGKSIKRRFIYSVPYSMECQEPSTVSPQRPHYPLNFQLLQRQMSSPGIPNKPVNDKHGSWCHLRFSRRRYMRLWSNIFHISTTQDFSKVFYFKKQKQKKNS